MSRTRWEHRNRALHSVPTQRPGPTGRHRSAGRESPLAGLVGVPGPATLARQVVPAGETVLWAASGNRIAHDVTGLDEKGQATAAVWELGRGTATVPTELDPGPGGQPPDVVVFGDHPGCLAHTTLRHVAPTGVGEWRTWALTSARLLVLDVHRVPVQRRTGSLLRKTIGLGRELVDIVTDRARRYGDNAADVPVTCPPMTVTAAVERSRIGDITVSRRRLCMRTRPCLRMSFVDGSGLDLLLGVDDESVFEWMLCLGLER